MQAGERDGWASEPLTKKKSERQTEVFTTGTIHDITAQLLHYCRPQSGQMATAELAKQHQSPNFVILFNFIQFFSLGKEVFSRIMQDGKRLGEERRGNEMR